MMPLLGLVLALATSANGMTVPSVYHLEKRPIFSKVERGGYREPLRATTFLEGITVAGGLAQLKWRSLTALGAKHAPSIAAGQYWRLFTPMVLHASPLHLACNLFSLHSIGHSLERWYGRERLVVTYVASGFAGNVLSCILNPRYPSLGASGAVAGLVGALAMHNLRHADILRNSQENLESIGRVILLNAALGIFEKGIDNAAHLGGLLGGAVAGFLIGTRFVPQTDVFGRTRGYRDDPLVKLPEFF